MMRIFLDVGAHTGETVKIALEEKYAFDRLYCFEPVPKCCQTIKALENNRVVVCEYGLWNQNCLMPLYNPGDRGASVFSDKYFRHPTAPQNYKFVRASNWFGQNLQIDDQVYLKLNCEGAECAILDDLIATGEWRKVKVAMIDFDVRKIPSQKHLMKEMKLKLSQLATGKIFYIDEYNLGKGTHSYFTHYWLDEAMGLR